MATLTTGKRQELWAELMRELSNDREPINVTKADLRAAVNAIDDFMDANAGAVNQAIPQPGRAELTTSQKARLLMFVVRYRYVEGL